MLSVMPPKARAAKRLPGLNQFCWATSRHSPIRTACAASITARPPSRVPELTRCWVCQPAWVDRQEEREAQPPSGSS
ncbi:hypothetical protein SVTN_11350 [Streptomyces vietnamensis]|uniref:Uncharacterized protein n=1 Tax=Streptomyces vietnamensis TaxID=362257 RepID=A0A0B5HS90_9ACTN|nr:hypothetical protein SVTN_11350 [Streptomyces vietnamensis]